MRDAFIKELLVAARSDPRVFLAVGDLGFGVVDDFALELPSRFLNGGVAEQNLLGVSAGLALEGYRPFVYSIANFPTFRALEQIRNDICYHKLPVTIVSVGAGVAYGPLGYSHYGVEDIAVMRVLPHMRVLSPADPVEAQQCVHEALGSDGPVYIRLGKNGEPRIHPEERLPSLSSPLVLREGHDLTILATGSVAGDCLLAADTLDGEGVTAAVVSCPTVSPFAREWLAAHPVQTPILTVEEHVSFAGFGSQVLEAASELGMGHRVVCQGLGRDALNVPGSATFVRSQGGLAPEDIYHRALEVLSGTRQHQD